MPKPNWIKPKFPPVPKQQETEAEREIRLANEAIKAATKKEDLIPIIIVEEKATSRKTKVEKIKVNNNGWGKDFTGKKVDWEKQESILVNHDTTKPKKQKNK